MPRTRFLRTRLYLLRACGSILCAAILIGLGSGAVFLTTESRVLSYLLEPLSLLLLPGLLIALGAAGAHDFSPNSVIYAAFAWYIVFFYLIFTWRYRHQARLIPGSEV
jgi:hypothetical protein